MRTPAPAVIDLPVPDQPCANDARAPALLPWSPSSAPPPDEISRWLDTLALAVAAGVRIADQKRASDRTRDGRLVSLRDHDGHAIDAEPGADTDDVLTVEDVAMLLKLGRNAVYDGVGRGEIPHRRIGKQIRFSRSGIMRWLASWSLQGAKEGT